MHGERLMIFMFFFFLFFLINFNGICEYVTVIVSIPIATKYLVEWIYKENN